MTGYYEDGITRETPAQKKARLKHRGYDLPPSRLEKLKVKEQYSWATPDLKVNDAPGRKVIIRGPALFSVEKFFGQGISRNKKKYVFDEVKRSARTLANVPIDVNHEVSLWEEGGKKGPKPKFKGNVKFGEEEDGQLEYLAEINDKEYAQKARDTDKVRKGLMTEAQYFSKWNKRPLAGVSVDANFLRLRCIKCSQFFYSGETYKTHMLKEHQLRDITVEPHGIVFKRLSLVEPPEVPGVVGADFEIVETAENGMLHLYEAMLQERALGVAVRRESQIGVSRTKHNVGLKMEDEKLETEECHEECDDGEIWDPVTKSCRSAMEALASYESGELAEKCSKREMARLFEDLLKVADDNMDRVREQNKLLQGDLKEIFNRISRDMEYVRAAAQILTRNNTDTIKESVNLVERVATLEDNFRATQRGKFKGQTPASITESAAGYAEGLTPKKKGK